MDVRLARLSRPCLLSTHDQDNPEHPPLPQMQLLVPRKPSPIYVGEQYHCLLVFPEGHGTASVYLMGPSTATQRSEENLLCREKLNGGMCSLNLQFDITEPGAWMLLVDLLLDGTTHTTQFPLEQNAQHAISVRTKVSKSSPAVQAYILEAQVENHTDSLLVVESCALIPMNEWQVSHLAEDKKTVILRPRDVQQYAFVLRNGANNDAGSIAVSWRRDLLGAKGWQKTGIIRV